MYKGIKNGIAAKDYIVFCERAALVSFTSLCEGNENLALFLY